jgi:6-phosphogluconolactonase (cycloisomerase 2 family)
VAYVGNELDSTVTVLAYTPPADADNVIVEDAVPAAAAAPAESAIGAEAAPCAAFDAHAADSPLRHLQTLSSLPAEEQGKSIITPEGIWKAASHSSELRLRPDGRFLYVGNRGHDSIAIYAVDEAAGGTLRLVEIASCGGACPRNFGFSRCGRFLVVGNQNSSTLVSFAVDAETGLLSRVATMALPSPNYVYSLPR